MELKSYRAPSGTAKLQCPMVGTLSSYSLQWLVVPLLLVLRWIPYPSAQTSYSRCSGFLNYLSLGHTTLDIIVMSDSASILDCLRVSKKSSLLVVYTPILDQSASRHPHQLNVDA